MPYLHTIEQVNECPIARAAELVGDLWVLLIVRDLMGGPKRFKNLQESLGSISPKTLSQRLKMLEETGLINREAFAEIPPRVEYSLTEKGLALSDVIEAIRNFGETHLPALVPQE
ncbi:MAG: helix-turn-helix transcriptional regulator [Anaerolineaceae bacterium]|nr:helix-turn-helix transcriptional regulator [Anaerolineaceae bacterium]